MTKHDLTQELLRENKISIVYKNDPNSEPIVHQKPYEGIKPQAKGRWKFLKNPQMATTKHPHGTDLTYKIVAVRINGKWQTFTLQNLVWVWYKGPIPKGYDVDHIDGDTMNNRIENLQLLSRKDNLAKRKGKLNQW